MAKEKLFTPEDFDKPVDKPWYKKTLTWIIGLVIIALGVGGAFYSYNNGTIAPPDIVTDTIPDTDSLNVKDSLALNLDSLKNDDINKSKETEDTIGVSTASESISILEVDTSSKDSAFQSSDPYIKRGETFEVDAKMAIRGDFGNGKIRKQKLGADYQEIQDIVNQLIREKKTKW